MTKTTVLWSVAIVAVLAAAGAFAVVGMRSPDRLSASHHHAGAPDGVLDHGMAGDHDMTQSGMKRPVWPEAKGHVPSADEAAKLPQLSSIGIYADGDFAKAQGVSGGSGTLDDPYLITGYHITGDLYLGDTDACFVVAENWVDGQLTLNWNGQCVWIHHNYIRDLRVNENVQRYGLDTGGLIEANQINYVGQIRHYDGEFRNNVIGPRDDRMLPEGIFVDPENLLPFAKDTRVLNIDGWNQALFHHNTIYGSTDLKLHGHHHGTGFLATHSHYHGDDMNRTHSGEDHSDRWSDVLFTDNKIVDPTGYGIQYTDQAHAGDDQQATSEDMEVLSTDHIHHTHAEILRNELEGAGIWIDIFNADDSLHYMRNPGWLNVADNTIHMVERDGGILGLQVFGPSWQVNTGIWLYAAKEAQVAITGNTLDFQAKPQSNDPISTLNTLLKPVNQLVSGSFEPTAIHLDNVRDANITVSGNQARGFTYGLAANSMDELVNWYVFDNQFDAPNPVSFDESVFNKPVSHAGPAGAQWSDDVPGGEPQPHEDEHAHH